MNNKVFLSFPVFSGQITIYYNSIALKDVQKKLMCVADRKKQKKQKQKREKD